MPFELSIVEAQEAIAAAIPDREALVFRDRRFTYLPPRQVGEICIGSPVNMLGCWNLPEATAKTLVDGFVHTGDAGYLDDDGHVGFAAPASRATSCTRGMGRMRTAEEAADVIVFLALATYCNGSVLVMDGGTSA